MIIFIHIPKTAGTSFRLALEKYYPQGSILADYGPVAPETSDELRELEVPTAEKKKEVIQTVNDLGIKAIAGHFPARKYFKIFPDAHFVAFVREPLQRCYSEYLHFCRFKKFEGEFLEFCKIPRFINLQSRMLKHVPENAFIGTTERYKHYLKTLNHTLGIKLPHLVENRQRWRLRRTYSFDDETISTFTELNKADCQLYDRINSEGH